MIYLHYAILHIKADGTTIGMRTISRLTGIPLSLIRKARENLKKMGIVRPVARRVSSGRFVQGYTAINVPLALRFLKKRVGEG